MKKTIFFLMFFVTIALNGQCFDCYQNIGGVNNDVPVAIKKSGYGVYLLRNSDNANSYAALDKYDFDCNHLWTKKFNDPNVEIKDLAHDDDGYLYVLYAWNVPETSSTAPVMNEWLPMNPGLNLYKLTPEGDFMWHRFMGYGDLNGNLNNVFIRNNFVYFVSSHFGHVNVDNQFDYNFPYSVHTRPYLCKLMLDGSWFEIRSIGTGTEDYTACEMDDGENMFLSRYVNNGAQSHADIQILNYEFTPVMVKAVSQNSIYRITRLYYNPDNDKLYAWGAFNSTVNVLGNTFTTSSNTYQSLLGEFNSTNANLERIMRIDNNSSLALPGIGGNTISNTAYMINSGSNLYVLSSFRGTLNFPEETITSTTYNGNNYSEDLVLFKVDLTNFSKEYVMKSNGVPNLTYAVKNAPGPILLDYNNLVLTSSFSSKPMFFNDNTINNNSSNNATDVMLYRFVLNQAKIKATNTCVNDVTSFTVQGNYDTILWNFGDNGSANNTSNLQNPTHQFPAVGTYHVTLTLTCVTESDVIEKDIIITNTSVTANNYAASVCDNGNDGTESINLADYDSFFMNGSGNTFTYYSSSNGAINQITAEQLTFNHTVTSGLNTIYIRIDPNNGCYAVAQLQLTLVSVPMISIPDEVILCENSIVSVHAGSGFNSYLWSTNATSPSIAINQPGNHSVTVTKNHGTAVCSSTKNFTVVLSNAPTITSIDTVDWTDGQNSITVNATGLGTYEYSIDGINFQDSNIFSGLAYGAYNVTVREPICGIDTQQVFLLGYPKFFTPNSDGNNDSWSIKFSQFEPNFEVRIFDRYGKLLSIMKNNEAWDGNYNGRQLPSDDYWFYVIRNDGRIYRGHFAMLR